MAIRASDKKQENVKRCLPPSQSTIAELMHSFETFKDEKLKLDQAYQELREEYDATQEELAESNRQLKLKVDELDVIIRYLNGILSHISQAILFIDFDGYVITYNDEAEKILGKKRLEVLFTLFWENFDDTFFGFSLRQALYHKTAPQKYLHTILAFSETKKQKENQLEKEKKEVEIDTAFIHHQTGEKDKEGKLISPIIDTMNGLIIMVRDITDLRRLQKIASRNDRMKELGEMAAIVAHEIRNPLGGIMGYASLLKRDLKDRPKQEEMVKRIISGTEALNEMVNRVLHYTRPIEVHIKQIELVRVLKEVVEHMKADKRCKHCQIIFLTQQEEEFYISTDEMLIKSALYNLILNSLQASKDYSTISISLEHNKKEAVISVADEGEGIARDDLEKVFTPFFTTKSEGNGFGLSEVYKIAQALAGSIEVKSVVNQGSTFSIHLPLTAGA